MLCDTNRYRRNIGIEIENFRYFRYRIGIGIERGVIRGIGIGIGIVRRVSEVLVLVRYCKKSLRGIGIGIGIET